MWPALTAHPALLQAMNTDRYRSEPHRILVRSF
ncbi:hypothetical protein [Klebsiella phage Kpn74]|uniref:Uncharacterized protein n=1 Tax=Klebsiella phage Kpn74 TaxID=3044026 RepID=A0AAT9V5E8_9CAUD|nr:hypothetical protein [Klebsiella phage Kpn74]